MIGNRHGVWHRLVGMTRSQRFLRPAVLVAVAGLLAASCGDDSDTTPADTAGGDPVLAIDGATYLSDSLTGRDLVDGTRLSLGFEDGRLNAGAGCNTIGGGYSVADGLLVLDGPLMQTEMACDQPVMDQETWFAEFLASSPGITQDGDQLTLTGSDVTVVFLDREVADPDRPLEGTTWAVVGTFDTMASSSVPEGASLVFADGSVAVATGCNTGSATYEVNADGTEVTFGPMALTKMACVDEEGQRLEAAVISVIDGTVPFEITAGSMTLGDDDLGLMLGAAE